jgi:hypothetical protein
LAAANAEIGSRFVLTQWHQVFVVLASAFLFFAGGVASSAAPLPKLNFRRGSGYEPPWECFGPNGYGQNGIYMTSVTVPWAVLSASAPGAPADAAVLPRVR